MFNKEFIDKEPKERIKASMDVIQKLEAIFKNSNEARVVAYFDLIAWLESKIMNQTFVDIYKKEFFLKIKSAICPCRPLLLVLSRFQLLLA